MSDTETLAFIRRVLTILDEADDHSALYWHVDHPASGPGLQLLIMCNDVFFWGTADAEPITPENVGLLEQAWTDLKVCGSDNYVGELFAARARKLRPQQPYYRKMPNEVKALFDACGPERDRKDEG